MDDVHARGLRERFVAFADAVLLPLAQFFQAKMRSDGSVFGDRMWLHEYPWIYDCEDEGRSRGIYLKPYLV